MIALIHHKVKDYASWRPYFDADKPRRTAGGVASDKVYQDPKDPNNIYLMFEISDIDAFTKMGQDPEFPKVLEKAGVIGMPEVTVLAEA